MWNRQRFVSASDLEMVSNATQCVVTASAEAPSWQIIEIYWSTTMQKNNIWSIAFVAHREEILKEVR